VIRAQADSAYPVRPRRLSPRHPAEVTSDRLGDHAEKWYETTDGDIQHAISVVRDWLDRIAEESENDER
jgi:hypothetical protein